jgi:hypothetical protein
MRILDPDEHEPGTSSHRALLSRRVAASRDRLAGYRSLIALSQEPGLEPLIVETDRLDMEETLNGAPHAPAVRVIDAKTHRVIWQERFPDRGASDAGVMVWWDEVTHRIVAHVSYTFGLQECSPDHHADETWHVRQLR